MRSATSSSTNRGQRTVAARIAGRIEQVIRERDGQMSTEGDELASLHQPDLLVTVDHLARRQASQDDRIGGSRDAWSCGNRRPIRSTRFLTSGKANTHLIIRSPITATLSRKYIREGQYVEQGMPLYEIADLATSLDSSAGL